MTATPYTPEPRITDHGEVLASTSTEMQDYEIVGPAMGCPNCGEDDMDALICNDDDSITCTTCGRDYIIEDAGKHDRVS